MTLLLIGLGLIVASGLLAAVLSRRIPWAGAVGAFGTAAGCALAVLPVLGVLAGHAPLLLDAPWSVPNGRLTLLVDPLAAVFLAPLFGLSGVTALYGWGYLDGKPARRRTGGAWLAFALLVACMALVVLARNGVLFLVAWEGMALASFMLVTWDHEEASVRSAGWTYLLATHLGTMVLLVLFAWLGSSAGSWDFTEWRAPVGQAGLCFALALVGFGTKAGFVPVHVWLPDAHPAAPSHVSALMSGVMIKTGLYGLLRLLPVLGAPEAGWGWALLLVGLASALLAVLWALAQGDLKRLLAYSSVENVGIIGLAAGLALLARAEGSDGLAVLALVAGLLHVWNHAAFKGLLFLGAGAVRHATGTLEIDRLGGLLRRMPWTGVTFLIGVAAICGLPPLNGFMSEVLLYLGAFSGIAQGTGPMVALLAVLVGLSIVGGLVLAAFAKAFGVSFLGQPRSDAAEHAHEGGLALRLPLAALALACAGLAAAAPWLLARLAPAAAWVLGVTPELATEAVAGPAAVLRTVVWVSLGFGLLIAALAGARALLLRGRPVSQALTWDCGYAKPTARMQYTASSFVEPLTHRFGLAAGLRSAEEPVQGLFPARAALATSFPDRLREQVYVPLFAGLSRGARALRRLQSGRTQLYVLYIVLTLVVLLVWRLG